MWTSAITKAPVTLPMTVHVSKWADDAPDGADAGPNVSTTNNVTTRTFSDYSVQARVEEAANAQTASAK